MIQDPSILRRVYDGVTLFALLNVLGLIGLFGLLSTTGALDSAKLRNIVAVMRGTAVIDPEAKLSNSQPVSSATEQKDAASSVEESEMDVQVMRIEGERIRAELDQRLALNNSILLRVTTERERFKRERDVYERREAQAKAKRQSQGFKKQIAIYEALASKVALEHLLSLSDPDEAAVIFLELDTRKAKKIVESAKSGDQMQKMKTILQRIREVEPGRFSDLTPAGG